MGLQGGTVYDLAFHPTTPATMYAAAPNGFYRSTDSGATWQQASTPTSYYLRPSALAVTPANPDHLYIALRDGGALRSVDRGSTLADASPPNAAGATFELEHCCVSGWIGHLLCNQFQRVSQHRSGRHAAAAGTLPWACTSSRSCYVDRDAPQTVYAAAFGGIYRSTDGAASLGSHSSCRLTQPGWCVVDGRRSAERRANLACNRHIVAE